MGAEVAGPGLIGGTAVLRSGDSDQGGHPASAFGRSASTSLTQNRQVFRGGLNIWKAHGLGYASSIERIGADSLWAPTEVPAIISKGRAGVRMPNDLENTLFLAAREAHETARRWQILVVLALLLFHAMLFAPYIRTTDEKVAVEARIERSTALQERIESVTDTLNGLGEATVDEATVRLGAVLGDLLQDFDRLNGIVEKLLQMTPDEASGPKGEELFASSTQASTVQMPAQSMAINQMQSLSFGRSLAAMSPEMRREVAIFRGTSNRQGLLEMVKPYVEKAVIQPALSRFNASWQSEALPRAQASAQAARDALAKAKAQFSEQAELWANAELGIEKIIQLSSQLKLQEPENDPFWWSTRAQKGGTILDVLIDLKRARSLGQLESLSALKAETDTAIAEQTARKRDLEAQLASLREQFKEQEAALASIIQPLKVVAIDLGRLVSWFPLVLGLVLAGSLAWTTERLRELIDTIALFSDGAAKALPARWLATRIRRTNGAAIALRGAAFLAWIAFAGSQVARLPSVDSHEALLWTVLGGAAVVGASLHQWRTVKGWIAHQ